jgi:Kef-type K+ transport system membrane component KefB
MTAHDVMQMLLALGILLGAARALGDLARRFRQPEVLGEILAGVLLGPTVLGALAPGVTASLFPAEGPTAIAISGVTSLGITLFLLVAGLEVDFPAMRQHAKVAVGVGAAGVLIPFALGFGVAAAPGGLIERAPTVPPLVFALFFGTAMSISALPVIARVLMDLNIYRTNVGTVTIGAAFGDNLVGAIMFTIILGMTREGSLAPGRIATTVALAVGFTALMLTVVRGCVHRVLPWIEDRRRRAGGVLEFALMLTLLGAALSEWLGLHAVLGAFLVGVVIGDSSHFRDQTRSTITHFVSAFFAPLFFAAIGLRVNFVASFDWSLVLVVLVVATAGKVVGCGLSARWSGWSLREAGAIGFAMNARGAMEILFGLLGYQHGVISERVFVALVVMAITTSMMSGPAMQRLLRLEQSPSVRGRAEGQGLGETPALDRLRDPRP